MGASLNTIIDFNKIDIDHTKNMAKGIYFVESLRAKALELDHSASTNTCESEVVESFFKPRKIATKPLPVVRSNEIVNTFAAPLEVWEGTVVHVEKDFMEVSLDSKTHQVAKHLAEIDFELVVPQDRDLVKPGAVFYLSFYEKRVNGSMRYAKELRFRRLPSWSASQIARINAEAEVLLKKFKVPPTAV